MLAAVAMLFINLFTYLHPTELCFVTWLRRWLHRLFDQLAATDLRPSCAGDLIDRLSSELLVHVLLVGRMEGVHLTHCLIASKGIAAAAADPASDEALWGSACRTRWSSRAYNPAELYARTFDRSPGLCSHQSKFRWTETDGVRRRGTEQDLCLVEAWEVTLIKRLRDTPYRIAAFPYRSDGLYRAHGNSPKPYTVQHVSVLESAFVKVQGLPTVRLVRREDWGWELRNPLWVARSLSHRHPPFD